MTNLTPLARAAMTGMAASKELNKLQKAATELEAGFLKNLVQMMRKSNPENSIGQNLGGPIYQDLFDQAVANSLSHGSPLGIGSMIERNASRPVFAAAAAEVHQREFLVSRLEAATRANKAPQQDGQNAKTEKGTK